MQWQVDRSMHPIQPRSMYTHSHHTCANPLPKQKVKRPPRKSGKKAKLSQLMLGMKFMKGMRAQVERKKQQAQSRYTSNFILASIFRFSSFSCCTFYTSYTTHNKEAKNLKVWLKKKNKEKRKKGPKFCMRTYAARTGATNIHEIKVSGMRLPYDLQVS